MNLKKKAYQYIGNVLIKFLLKANKEDLFKVYDISSKLYQSSKYSDLRRRYNISNSFRFNGIHIHFYGEGEIYCGENSYIGNYSTIAADVNQKVVIGDNCAISHNVRIYTSSNLVDQDFNSSRKNKKKYGDVIINDGVWIGANVFIKEGVTIGTNSVIGANSVVIKNIESNSIYAGVPAKLIRKKNIEK